MCSLSFFFFYSFSKAKKVVKKIEGTGSTGENNRIYWINMTFRWGKTSVSQMPVLDWLSNNLMHLLVAHSPAYRYAGKKKKKLYPVLNLNGHAGKKWSLSCCQVNDCKLSHCFRTHHTVVSHWSYIVTFMPLINPEGSREGRKFLKTRNSTQRRVVVVRGGGGQGWPKRPLLWSDSVCSL